MFKTRSFVITNWNLNTEEVFNLNKNKIRFIAFGEEIAPTTGKKHHQCFLYFFNQHSTSKKTLCKIGEMFKLKEGDVHANVEFMRGSFDENQAYCSKDGIYTELGDKPRQGLRGDLDETKEMIKKGELTVDDICMLNPMMFHQYGRTLAKIEEIALRKKFRNWMTSCDWIYGDTGIGKSHKAFENFNPDTHYVKNLNTNFWDGYIGQSTVIINEFRGQIRFSELLDLIDKWPKSVDVKGKPPVPFLAKHIIITSCKHPEDVYVGVGESINQLLRRIKIIHLE